MRFHKGIQSLNDSISVSAHAPVWLILFDPLPEIQPRSPAVAFDGLESQSMVFEQYLLQDIREQSTMDDYLGGAESIGNHSRSLACVAGRSVWLQVRVDDAAAEITLPASFKAPALTAVLQPQIFSLSTEFFDGIPEPLSAAVSNARFVLVTVRSGGRTTEESAATTHMAGPVERMRVADQVLARLQALAAAARDGQTTPVWLVTGFRGVSRPLERPFDSGADESQLHVPLWWTEPLSAGTRLQNLCGSFDLLPTLAELLRSHTGSTPSPSMEMADATVDGEAERAVSEPVSLLSAQLQGSRGGDRLLRLHHDAWEGLRTSQYFLVQPLQGLDEENADAGEFSKQQLYLKPEDYWNVNNSIVSFAEIAREMSDGV
ncbi:MAG: hypothetical protein ACKO2P_09660 [Planctomycetota bacterium]